jgi:SAM-dependent methyltransferase
MWDCPSCRCSFVWPRPSESELHALYAGYGATFEQLNPRLRHRRDERYRTALRLAEQALGRPGSLLDVGCSTGGFLGVAKTAGWDPVGIEVDESAARVAAERTAARVHVGSGAASWPDNQTFDLVSMSHYIEHVRDPAGEIAAAVNRLRAGGVLLVRTPNVGSRVAQAFGSLWTWFTPPSHLTYFQPQSFRVLAERSGLVVRSTRVWRGDGYSVPCEIALAVLRGISGPAVFSWLEETRKKPEGVRAITALKLLDSSSGVRRMFSRWDDSEVMVLLEKPNSRK